VITRLRATTPMVNVPSSTSRRTSTWTGVSSLGDSVGDPWGDSVALRDESRGGPDRRVRRAPLRAAVGRSFGKWLALGALGLAMLMAGGPLLSMLMDRFNPMAVKTIDRTGPTLLTAISDMHTYQAASGEFQVMVDIEKDAKWLPSAIRGERVVLLAQGSVDAGVDLGAIGPRSIVTDSATGAITVTIPHATLGSAHVNLKYSTIVRHDRGLFDRIGSTFGDASQTDNAAFVLAEAKLQKAAIDSALLAKAEANTAAMLRQLIAGLGHPNVTIGFNDTPVPAGPPAP
jgi:Protein of unknown function (DUF4230)